MNFTWSILKILLANLHSKLSYPCLLWLTQQNLGPETLPAHLFPQSFKTFFFSFFNQQVFFILLFQRPGPVPEFHVKNRHSAFAWHSSWHSSALSMFFNRYFFPGLLIAPPLKWVFSSRQSCDWEKYTIVLDRIWLMKRN